MNYSRLYRIFNIRLKIKLSVSSRARPSEQEHQNSRPLKSQLIRAKKITALLIDNNIIYLLKFLLAERRKYNFVMWFQVVLFYLGDGDIMHGVMAAGVRTNMDAVFVVFFSD